MLYSLYLHIPFCSHRCAYCDFNTYAGQGTLIPEYVAALRKEIAHVGARAPADMRVHTIFFGGGTPSLLSAVQLEGILRAVRSAFTVEEGAEITLEANPGTVDAVVLRELRAGGINRLSLGVQSANGEELRLLERTHSYLEVIEAVRAARVAGFENLNLDLIYGLPEQALRTWQTTVRRVLDLRPEHISAYALSLEHGTPFGRWATRGLLAAPDPDLAADMYEWASEELEAAGYAQYEISNWAIPGHECQHNLQYWRGQPYLGLGAGAHGYAVGYRYSNVLRIRTYIDSLRGPGTGRIGSSADRGRAVGPSLTNASPSLPFPMSPAALAHHRQSRRDDISDFMLTGLRLTREGISRAAFSARFGEELSDVFGPAVSVLQGVGLLEAAAFDAGAAGPPSGRMTSAPTGSVRLSKRGRLLANQVFAHFVD